jgi:hypothetical protein
MLLELFELLDLVEPLELTEFVFVDSVESDPEAPPHPPADKSIPKIINNAIAPDRAFFIFGPPCTVLVQDILLSIDGGH